MVTRLQEVMATIKNKKVILHLFLLICFIMSQQSRIIRMCKDQRLKKEEEIRPYYKMKG